MTSEQWMPHVVHFSLTPPYARAGHTMVFSPTDRILRLVGGFGSTASSAEASRVVTVPATTYGDVWEFAMDSCPGACNQRGACVFGYCVCNDGYFGSDCQNEYCPSTVCSYDYGGSLLQSCKHCSGNGVCLNGVCLCVAGFAGDDCSTVSCPNDCSGQGTCRANVTADTGATVVPPTPRVTTSVLLATTSPAKPYAACACAGLFVNGGCFNQRCPDDCSQHGTCNGFGVCTCEVTEIGKYVGINCGVFELT
jgi:tenascin